MTGGGIDERSPSLRRVAEALAEHSLDGRVVELPDSTRTAREAAEALGCSVAQIAKSIVFRREDSGGPLLVIASGANRVDEDAVAREVGTMLGKADAAFVRERTGFVIGGVAPVGHLEPVPTLVDEDLFRLDVLWAAAGTPRSVFPLTAEELVRITGGRVTRVATPHD